MALPAIGTAIKMGQVNLALLNTETDLIKLSQAAYDFGGQTVRSQTKFSAQFGGRDPSSLIYITGSTPSSGTRDAVVTRTNIESGCTITIHFAVSATIPAGGSVAFYFTNGTFSTPSFTVTTSGASIYDWSGVPYGSTVQTRMVITGGSAGYTVTGSIGIDSITVTSGTRSYVIVSPTSYSHSVTT